MTVFTFFGISLINILLTLAGAVITGCGIAVGFDIWKKIKSWRKNKKYLRKLREENFGREIAAAGVV